MNEIMLSIRPKWCELIASGQKTIEVRKTKPKCNVPFKVYIYCTQSRIPVRYDESIVMFEDDLAITNRFGCGKHVENPYGMLMEGEFLLNCTVIGEFVCDRVYELVTQSQGGSYYVKGEDQSITNDVARHSCLTLKDMHEYLRSNVGFGWHISDLIVYDKPRDLSDFGMKRPPQSWCYVEKERESNDE